MEWDKKALMEEISGYENGVVNWSELARKYQVKNKNGELVKNGGQIVQEYLKFQGVDVSKFKKRGSDDDGGRIRKRIKRSAGGEISVPCPVTNEELRDKLSQKILSGEYNVGELIVPRKYEKFVLDPDSSIIKTHFFVEGSKCPLHEIREQKLEELKEYTRANPDEDLDAISYSDIVDKLNLVNEMEDVESEEKMRMHVKDLERTRHLMIWHDLSTVANHSHLVFMVTCLYDPAFFYTDGEYEQLTKKKISVQAKVESPSVYIVARSSSSDKEQLCYAETRLECLKDLSHPVTSESGLIVNDKMRFFQGDTPARQYECGQQKGGKYYCAICGASANCVHEMDYSFRCSHMSLADRQDLVLKGPYGKKYSLQKTVIGFKPKKLTARKLYGTYFHNITSHAPIQNRLISGRSANTEEQERIFNAITNITRTTSSFHADHVTANILVRLQAEKHLSANHHASSVEKQQAQVSKLASSLPSFPNTIIPKDMLVNHPSSWQAHLERISDFLLVGKGAWWNECENGDIHFFDAKGSPELLEKGPLLHHFRSSSFKSEESYLKKCWLKCVEQRASGDHISVEVVSDDLPNDELVSDSIMDSGVVAGDGATKVAGSDDRVNLPNGVVDGTDAVVACENVVVDSSFVVAVGSEGEVLGDSDVSFDKTISDDKFVDATVTATNCTSEVNVGQDVKNTVKNPELRKRKMIERNVDANSAPIMKRAVMSKAVAEKIAESVRKQKLIVENYCVKWREICKQSKFRRQIAINVNAEKSNSVSDVNNICPNELTPLDENTCIGSGTFGECTLKLYKRFNLVVLEKQLSTSNLKAVINEAKCMNILTHPNIPQLLGVQTTCKPYALIMEFIGEDMKSSTVHQLLEETSSKGSPLLTPEWISVCVNIVEAANHIHSKGYLHCDLKTNSVLVLKKRGKPTAKKYTSFYHYIAPEVLRGQPVSSSSDVFSLGVIISTIAKTVGNKSMYSDGRQCKDTKPQVRPSLPTLITQLQGIIEKDNS
ncbi:Retrovirus-related Pol poly from transposon opus [Paramuricea clavata]|nr:Retrovirus-related Pol poly from transposon opus [Paramuricea clavata]